MLFWLEADDWWPRGCGPEDNSNLSGVGCRVSGVSFI